MAISTSGRCGNGDVAPDRRAGDEQRRQHPRDRHEQPLPPRQAIDAPAGHRDAEDQNREPQRDRLEHDQRHQQREPRGTPRRERQAQQVDRGILDRVADDREDTDLDRQHEHAGDHLRGEAADARAEALGGIAAPAAQAAGIAPHGIDERDDDPGEHQDGDEQIERRAMDAAQQQRRVGDGRADGVFGPFAGRRGPPEQDAGADEESDDQAGDRGADGGRLRDVAIEDARGRDQQHRHAEHEEHERVEPAAPARAQRLGGARRHDRFEQRFTGRRAQEQARRRVVAGYRVERLPQRDGADAREEREVLTVGRVRGADAGDRLLGGDRRRAGADWRGRAPAG